MRWQWTENLVQRDTKIKKYQKIFADLDFGELKSSLPEWSLPDFMWQDFNELQNCSPERAEQIISNFQDMLKSWSNKKNYLHVANMIFGAVYFKGLYNRTSESSPVEDRITAAARNYNWDRTKIIAKSWNEVEVRDSYSLRVARYWREEQDLMKTTSQQED